MACNYRHILYCFPSVIPCRRPELVIARINGWPSVAPVSASACASRRIPHDLGPG